MRITVRRSWRRVWLRYEWEVYNSAYGLVFGYAWTHQGAQRCALRGVGQLVTAEEEE